MNMKITTTGCSKLRKGAKIIRSLGCVQDDGWRNFYTPDVGCNRVLVGAAASKKAGLHVAWETFADFASLRNAARAHPEAAQAEGQNLFWASPRNPQGRGLRQKHFYECIPGQISTSL